MIHLLEVHPAMSLAELKKLSRRYAMTGGYELSIKDGLEASDLEALIELMAPEVKCFQKLNSEMRSSNAYRILQLVLEHPCVDTVMVKQVEKLLRLESDSE